jgi:DnaA family protein
MKQLPLRIAPGPAPTLANFAPGANAALVAALHERPLPASVYLWGPAGVGKSHLLAALAAGARDRGEPVVAADAATLATSPSPWEWPEAGALVLIDGCESLDAAAQHAAFALYVGAAGCGAPVVAAGRLPPVDLPVREDLRTRLGSGLVFRVQPLGDREALEVLVREAARRGIALSDEVTGYLLTRFARDLGSLMGLLDALDDFSLSQKRSVTVPLLRRMLAERVPDEGLPVPALWVDAQGGVP